MGHAVSRYSQVILSMESLVRRYLVNSFPSSATRMPRREERSYGLKVAPTLVFAVEGASLSGRGGKRHGGWRMFYFVLFCRKGEGKERKGKRKRKEKKGRRRHRHQQRMPKGDWMKTLNEGALDVVWGWIPFRDSLRLIQNVVQSEVL